MTDRLPQPMSDAGTGGYAERASASPVLAKSGVLRPLALHDQADGAAQTLRSRETTAGAPRMLADVEAWMIGGILSRDAPLHVDSVFSDGPRQTAGERFDIYRSGYRARLVECLLDDYPVLAESLGGDRFEALCAAYIDRHPSTSPNLNAFGRRMAEFCRTDAAGLGEPVFHSELATLEWAVVESIHAETSESFDATRLRDLGAENFGALRFVPSGAVKLLKFEYPVNAYYQSARNGAAPVIPARAESATAVYRRALTVWRMDLTPAMTRVLEALLAGLPLGDALSRIGLDEADDSAVKEAERSVMVWFREWVSSGFFANCSC